MDVKHGGCANCLSREETTLQSGLIGPALSAKLGFVGVSIAVCSKCINEVELTKGGSRG